MSGIHIMVKLVQVLIDTWWNVNCSVGVFNK